MKEQYFPRDVLQVFKPRLLVNSKKAWLKLTSRMNSQLPDRMFQLIRKIKFIYFFCQSIELIWPIYQCENSPRSPLFFFFHNTLAFDLKYLFLCSGFLCLCLMLAFRKMEKGKPKIKVSFHRPHVMSHFRVWKVRTIYPMPPTQCLLTVTQGHV